MRTSRRKGFTLIELIIVIVVLGILAGIAIAGYTAVIRRANISSVEQSALSFNRELTNLAAQQAASSGQTGEITDKTTRLPSLLLEAFQAGDGPNNVTVVAFVGADSASAVRTVIWDGSAIANAASIVAFKANYEHLMFVKSGASICLRLTADGTMAKDTQSTATGALVVPSDTTAGPGWLVMRRTSAKALPTVAVASTSPSAEGNACNDVSENDGTGTMSGW